MKTVAFWGEKKNGRLTGLVTSYVETAFYNKLLNER